MSDLDRQHDEIFRKAAGAQNKEERSEDHGIRATAHAPQQIVNQTEGKSALAIWLAAVAALFSGVALAMSIMSAVNTSGMTSMAEQMGRAVAKAETATARANTAEIYAYQVYIELNRLGYPVKSPAEAHAPHPPEPVTSEEP